MLNSQTTSQRAVGGWRACLAAVSLFAAGTACVGEPAVAQPPAEAEAGAREHPLVPALRLAKAGREALGEVRDFEATFSKREQVGRRMIPHDMDIKFRSEPFSVYLRFHKPHEGREVLYVEGKHDGRLLARESGFKGLLGTLALRPDSPEAMSEGRHPITRIGLANMLQGIIDQWEAETEFGETEVKYYQNARLDKMECMVIESTHPHPRRQFKFHKTRLWIDRETNLPVRVEQYGFPTQQGANPPLVEEYTYTNLRTNVGLTDADFDPRNPNYGF